MGTATSKQTGGGYPTPLEKKQIESQILRIARRFQGNGIPPLLREKLRIIAERVFNHQNELSKGNTVLQNLYFHDIQHAFEESFPPKTPDEKIKIDRFTNELVHSIGRLIEKNTWTRSDIERGDPVQKEHLETQMAPSLRRANAQQNATRRWRLIQGGGFLDLFKQRSEEPTTILHKRLRRRKTRKQSQMKKKDTSGFFSFLRHS